jgi:hypothetical protein
MAPLAASVALIAQITKLLHPAAHRLDRLTASLYMTSRLCTETGEYSVPPIHISDPETDDLVRRLAAKRSLSLTETIKLAISNELSKEEANEMRKIFQKPREDDADDGSLRDLEAEIRSTTLEYSRLRAKRRGTKGVGSRVYQMLARHGAVETLNRLVNRPTEGLEFLKLIDRFDWSAEKLALDPRYQNIISEDIRDRARANLDKIGWLPSKSA